MVLYHDEKVGRLRDLRTGRFVADNPAPDEVCPNGCVRFGDWWVPEDCPEHIGGF
jgi:hypothetical protein